jgi:hypothetical protein
MTTMTPDSELQTRNAILEGYGVLFINENLPLPFDIRPWQEALALKEAGMEVSVLCPRGKGFEKPYECLKGIHIYRHPFPKGNSLVPTNPHKKEKDNQPDQFFRREECHSITIKEEETNSTGVIVKGGLCCCRRSGEKCF